MASADSTTNGEVIELTRTVVDAVMGIVRGFLERYLAVDEDELYDQVLDAQGEARDIQDDWIGAGCPVRFDADTAAMIETAEEAVAAVRRMLAHRETDEYLLQLEVNLRKLGIDGDSSGLINAIVSELQGLVGRCKAVLLEDDGPDANEIRGALESVLLP